MCRFVSPSQCSCCGIMKFAKVQGQRSNSQRSKQIWSLLCDWNSSFNSQKTMKWCTKFEEAPYNFSSSEKFVGHMGWKIVNFDLNRTFLACNSSLILQSRHFEVINIANIEDFRRYVMSDNFEDENQCVGSLRPNNVFDVILSNHCTGRQCPHLEVSSQEFYWTS